MLARVGPSGRVIAIEPHATFAETLRQLGAEVLTLAVGDRNGEATLYLDDAYERATLYEPNTLEAKGETRVKIRTLDSLQDEGVLPQHIDVMKIDTQGAEVAVLLGGEQLLRRSHPRLYLEVWRTGLEGAGSSVEALTQILASHGYQPDGYRDWPQVVETAGSHSGHQSFDVLTRA